LIDHSKSAWLEFEKQQMAALMKLLKGPLWVWLSIGVIGLGLIAYADIFERIKARQTTLGLHGTISN